jgi:probable F420-dependent oxidoreductase
VLTLTWAAAVTKHVRLGTSVLVLPLRHPLPLAKELATLQNLSGGRLILGAGVGWLEAEFDALGVPFTQRGRRMDEGIAMMRAVWSQDPVSFDSKWIAAKIDTMRSQPQPVRPIPIWIGGSSDAAIQRALRLDGWHGSRIGPDQAAALVKRLRLDRPNDDFTVSLRVSCNAHNVTTMRDVLGAYRDAGVQHVMAAPEDRDIDIYLATAEAFRRAGEGL